MCVEYIGVNVVAPVDRHFAIPVFIVSIALADQRHTAGVILVPNTRQNNAPFESAKAMASPFCFVAA
jgi:hypothetical protein